MNKILKYYMNGDPCYWLTRSGSFKFSFAIGVVRVTGDIVVRDANNYVVNEPLCFRI